jgi:WD40 repeat protein
VGDADGVTGHVFISYVREDAHHVDPLQRTLEAAGIRVWRDTAELWPGQDWAIQIRRAITNRALVFLACFSVLSTGRSKSYQNEELLLAIEQLRQRSADEAWLIPVRFDECEIPDRDLGAGRTLRSIQRVDLFGDGAGEASERLVTAIRQILNQDHRNVRALADPQEALLAEVEIVTSLTSGTPGKQCAEPATSTERDWRSDNEKTQAARSPARDAGPAAEPPANPLALHLSATGESPYRLARTLIGHSSGVEGVAFSPDSTLLATASNDTTARLWDPASGKQLRALTGHTTYVWGAAFSPDSAFLATTSGDETARLWDPATGTCLRTLAGHTSHVYGVAFNPSGALLATAGDETARLWDVITGTCLRTLVGHTKTVYGVAFSPDGALLATASYDGTVRLWDPATGTCLRNIIGHTSGVLGVAFSPDGAVLAITSYDGTVRLWGGGADESLYTLTGHASWVRGVAFSPDGAFLATASNDATVRLWQ